VYGKLGRLDFSGVVRGACYWTGDRGTVVDR
jgi:hypothetical protein